MLWVLKYKKSKGNQKYILCNFLALEIIFYLVFMNYVSIKSIYQIWHKDWSETSHV
ncbi:hypothetical protein ACJX0J_034360, partial [Zea mays]